MNPLVLLALGGVALVALGRKKTTTANGNGGGNGGGNGTGPGSGNGTGPGGWPGGMAPGPMGLPLSPLGQPQPGTFYQVSGADSEVNGNPIEAIASMAIFGSPTMTSADTRTYWKCINASPWNAYYYGVESNAPGAVEGVSADLALEQVNYDAVAALSGGRWPELAEGGNGGTVMGIHPGMGAAPGSPSLRNNFGLLWLPPAHRVVNPDFPGKYLPLVCPAGEWGGGISTLFPPPAILNSLVGTVPEWWAPQPPGGLV